LRRIACVNSPNAYPGVVAYTLFGGIKATFITDYINSLVIIVIIFIFAFTVYATSSILGSPGKVWEILTQLAIDRPLEGNAGGSYLTMKSQGGGEFAKSISYACHS